MERQQNGCTIIGEPFLVFTQEALNFFFFFLWLRLIWCCHSSPSVWPITMPGKGTNVDSGKKKVLFAPIAIWLGLRKCPRSPCNPDRRVQKSVKRNGGGHQVEDPLRARLGRAPLECRRAPPPTPLRDSSLSRAPPRAAHD